MPLSTRRYTELRLAISNCIQTRNWKHLFEICGTSDDEASKTIAGIFTLYDVANVWKFLGFVYGLSPGDRKQKRDSVATCCYILGKIGHSNTMRALAMLRLFLSDDHMLRLPVSAALSNFWVLDYRVTLKQILDEWVLKNDDNDDLQEIGIKSIEYLAREEPETAAKFLIKVAELSGDTKIASRTAREILEKYMPKSLKQVRTGNGIPTKVTNKKKR